MNDKKKILIVDDDRDIRMLISLTLRDMGCEVHQAANGRQGLDMISEVKPDLIILDVMMPEMTGIEFCKRIVEDLEELTIPILMVSAMSDKSKFAREFQDLPIIAKAFLRKPFDTSALTKQVLELTGWGAPESKSVPPPKTAPPPKSAAPPPPPKPAAAPPPPTEKVIPRHRLRVLCIDDDPDIRTLMKLTLGPYHEVGLAENGMAALEIIDQFQPDFVISDFDMPVLNGLQTVEAIRSHPRFSEIPVFILTGEKETSLPRKVFEVGGNLMLKKPIDPMRLIKVIDRFVEETDLRPQAPVAQKPSETKKAQEPSGPRAKPRVLTVHNNPDHVESLKEIFDKHANNKIDTFWCDEPRMCLGNLARWQPDVILYNPRQKTIDGIAFVQSLRLKKLLDNLEVAFIGTEFLPSDIDFSRKSFHRDPINLNLPEMSILKSIVSVFEAAKPKMTKPKRYSITDIQNQDNIRESKEGVQKAKLEKQRQFFKEKFRSIQDYIDQETKK